MDSCGRPAEFVHSRLQRPPISDRPGENHGVTSHLWRRSAGLLAASVAVAVSVATVGLVGADAAGMASRLLPPAPVAYSAPVSPLVVLRGFSAPASAYGPGHRGVDLAAPAGTVIVSAGAGAVSFAGSVAGRGVVVISHADGIRTEYEPVRPTVSAGQLVTRGQPIGVLHGGHLGCPPGACVHWGARRGTVYLDPLLLLRPLGPVRLLPWGAAHALGWARSNVLRSRSTETWV